LIGYSIVLKALEAPLKQIADNTGILDGAVVVQKVKEAGGNAGYDAAKGVMVEDMIKAGIIDPVKVERSCVQHAVSAAAILLTTEAAIADAPEEGGGGAPDMSGMGCMGGGWVDDVRIKETLALASFSLFFLPALRSEIKNGSAAFTSLTSFDSKLEILR